MKTSSINSKIIHSHNYRFEGEHYLNENSFLSLQLEENADKCVTLDSVATVFNPPVFKRQFCKEGKNSVQYFQSSDVQNADEYSSTYVFKGQAESLNLLVNKGDILVTGFGTIGNTRLVSKLQDNVCYANNVCRIRVNPSIKNGYIYAVLSSKYGIAQLNKNASGSVVRYIEAPGIKKTYIPNLSLEFQDKIDGLINESAELRVSATEALKSAHSILDIHLPYVNKGHSNCVSIKSIRSSFNKRFEASFYISLGSDIDNFIKSNYKWKSLGEVCSEISRPDIFKRFYVENGIPFLGSSDIFLAMPNSKKQLSKAKTSNINSLIIEENTILIPRSGTIGNVALSHSGHAQKLVSEDVIRVYPNNILRVGYIFAYLSSIIGKALIQRFIFGSVIQHVEPPLLDKIPIAIIPENSMIKIDDLIMVYSRNMGKAIELENKAISMVESEIEKWNKN